MVHGTGTGTSTQYTAVPGFFLVKNDIIPYLLHVFEVICMNVCVATCMYSLCTYNAVCILIIYFIFFIFTGTVRYCTFFVTSDFFSISFANGRGQSALSTVTSVEKVIRPTYEQTPRR